MEVLCPSGGYYELMLAQVEELCAGYYADGFWFDIYQAVARATEPFRR